MADSKIVDSYTYIKQRLQDGGLSLWDRLTAFTSKISGTSAEN